MAFHVARVSAGIRLPGSRVKFASCRGLASLKRLGAWSSKRSGALQNGLITAWRSGARSTPAAA
eukprot:1983093-Pyramimonas_sp.AAC.1